MEGIFTYLGAIFGHGQMLFVSHLVLTAIDYITYRKNGYQKP